jgi:hypothetical protein
MRGMFGLIGVILVVAAIGLVAKRQLSTPVAVPAVSGTASNTSVKPTEIPKQVQQELNNAMNDAAKRLEQAEGKQ